MMRLPLSVFFGTCKELLNEMISHFQYDTVDFTYHKAANLVVSANLKLILTK